MAHHSLLIKLPTAFQYITAPALLVGHCAAVDRIQFFWFEGAEMLAGPFSTRAAPFPVTFFLPTL